MGTLSRLCKQCKECKYVETCNHKRLEALAYFEPVKSSATITVSEPMAQSMLIAHDYRDIKIAESTTITIDLEKLKADLVKSHYPSLMQFGG